ncbi:MAG: hypothetical protein ABSC22_03305 [Roseiarcus sp.]|jgi:hypothetical protein
MDADIEKEFNDIKKLLGDIVKQLGSRSSGTDHTLVWPNPTALVRGGALRAERFGTIKHKLHALEDDDVVLVPAHRDFGAAKPDR